MAEVSERGLYVAVLLSFAAGVLVGWQANRQRRKYLDWRRKRLHDKLVETQKRLDLSYYEQEHLCRRLTTGRGAAKLCYNGEVVDKAVESVVRAHFGGVSVMEIEESEVWLTNSTALVVEDSFISQILRHSNKTRGKLEEKITEDLLGDAIILLHMNPFYLLTFVKNKIVINSIITGSVPQDWRVANVVPIFKKRTKTELGNYRPVSLTSTVGKILEGILRDDILEYLKRNNLMTQYQHGFTRDRSCQTNLISFYEEGAYRVEFQYLQMTLNSAG
ncbi:unnamed protein product [Ranitomeya imitator]|uniref:Reverse transcriptase domain-containing protein n=2 Tax=Dendrobatinae TaxID=490054 RepID=A0ABN9LXG7_9NEOB|nr:unnamed protein product [Ranitomeya imitator]